MKLIKNLHKVISIVKNQLIAANNDNGTHFVVTWIRQSSTKGERVWVELKFCEAYENHNFLLINSCSIWRGSIHVYRINNNNRTVCVCVSCGYYKRNWNQIEMDTNGRERRRETRIKSTRLYRPLFVSMFFSFIFSFKLSNPKIQTNKLWVFILFAVDGMALNIYIHTTVAFPFVKWRDDGQGEREKL